MQQGRNEGPSAATSFSALAEELAGRLNPHAPEAQKAAFVSDLVSLLERHHLARYRHGLPSPSTVARDLRRLADRCTSGRGGTEALADRLKALRDAEADSYKLLLFQSALDIDNSNPEQPLSNGLAERQLLRLAQSSPERIANYADTAVQNLEELRQSGRGGSRNRGKLVERELVHRLGILYEQLTGDAPRPYARTKLIGMVLRVRKVLGLLGHELKLDRRAVASIVHDLAESKESRWR